ncbi:hypothetical protein AB832_01105 [Flavobacteriaceae bacterium (ex Bugula neritina AB1)]|nr:hypothetical protein AB832_01105 [Flavobacteriaceae bacterium (ex Bugula neritina AB1)]
MYDIKKWFPYGTGTNKKRKLKVFCFYFAGGSSSVFRNWIGVSELIDFIPFELPGRGIRISEPYIEDIKDLVNEIIPVIYNVAQKTPFSLYGHSLGAMIAFQTAWELQERKLISPESLIVADEEIIEELRNLNGTPKEIIENKDIMRFMIPMIRSDLKLHESFKYEGQKLNIPITAHCGDGDHEADKMIMEYWKDMTIENFTLEEFKGDHFFIQSTENKYLDRLIDTVSNTFETSSDFR